MEPGVVQEAGGAEQMRLLAVLLLAFLRDLRANNDREWFNANKDRYLADLRDAVAAVKADPELAKQGGAATYGMLAHVPLRGMVKKKVLEMYSEQYRAGGGELDIAAGSEEGLGGGKPGLLDRIVQWYVQRQAGRRG